MANCHDLFQDFYRKIELASSKKDYLKQARDAVRDKIRKYFKMEPLKLVNNFTRGY